LCRLCGFVCALRMGGGIRWRQFPPTIRIGYLAVDATAATCAMGFQYARTGTAFACQLRARGDEGAILTTPPADATLPLRKSDRALVC
jgi:hypothetical protein